MSTTIKNIIGFAIAVLLYCLAMVVLKEFRVVNKEVIESLLVGGLTIAAIIAVIRWIL